MSLNMNLIELSFFTFMVVHGSRSLVYSLVVDSMRKAYFPFDSLTR